MTEDELKAIEAGIEWAAEHLGYIARKDFDALVAEIRRLRKLALASLDLNDWVSYRVQYGELVDRERFFADRRKVVELLKPL